IEHDVAAWFLSAIHRRLRTGKIQADVVSLAGRFADAFATTVEGASVHAALPTLRRSVGLCPRCAQPYIGIADACPKCLGFATNPPMNAPVDPDSTPDDRARIHPSRGPTSNSVPPPHPAMAPPPIHLLGPRSLGPHRAVTWLRSG